MVRPHSRRHGKLILAACGSQPLELALEGPFFFVYRPRQSRGLFLSKHVHTCMIIPAFLFRKKVVSGHAYCVLYNAFDFGLAFVGAFRLT